MKEAIGSVPCVVLRNNGILVFQYGSVDGKTRPTGIQLQHATTVWTRSVKERIQSASGVVPSAREQNKETDFSWWLKNPAKKVNDGNATCNDCVAEGKKGATTLNVRQEDLGNALTARTFSRAIQASASGCRHARTK